MTTNKQYHWVGQDESVDDKKIWGVLGRITNGATTSRDTALVVLIVIATLITGIVVGIFSSSIF